MHRNKNWNNKNKEKKKEKAKQKETRRRSGTNNGSIKQWSEANQKDVKRKFFQGIHVAHLEKVSVVYYCKLVYVINNI